MRIRNKLDGLIAARSALHVSHASNQEAGMANGRGRGVEALTDQLTGHGLEAGRVVPVVGGLVEVRLHALDALERATGEAPVRHTLQLR